MWYGPILYQEVFLGGVQSIERAFLLLDVVATADLGLTELAGRVDLPKSTAARILKTLEQVGAVERAHGRYRIGPSMMGLAGSSYGVTDLAARARPHLRVLARELGEDAGLSLPEGFQVHYVAQEDAHNDVQVRDWTGTLIPMHVVPSGLVMMANWQAERLNRFLRRQLETFTPQSVIAPGEVRSRLAQIRSDGFCWMSEEFAEGISSVAAPVYNAEHSVVGAIHVHGPTYRFPGDESKSAIAQSVVDASRRVSSHVAS